MKQLILFVLVFVLTLNLYSQVKKQEIDRTVNSEKFQRFLESVCVSCESLSTKSPFDAGEKIENKFLEFLGVTRQTKNYNQLISEFYNQYHQYFICHNKTKEANRSEHLLKRIIIVNMYRAILYGFILKDEEELPINVNSVEDYNGKQETVLDYLDNILANRKQFKQFTNEDFKELIILRETLIDDYGAKKASELK